MIPYANGRRRRALLMALTIALTLCALGLCLTWGASRMPLSDFFDVVHAQFTGQSQGGTGHVIVFKIRLPRALMAYAVGACLSLGGVTMQGIFKNPMAEPHILGVSSGAAFGAALTLIFGLGQGMLGLGVMSFGALIGGIGAALLVLLLSGGGRSDTTNLLLIGIAVGTFLSALLSGLLMLNHDKMEAVYTWTMGSFATASALKLRIIIPTALLGYVAIRCYARELNAMLMGESDARALGVNVGRARLILMCISTLMTAVAVSLSGVIGFVGLMVPHAVRFLVGPDHRATLPLSFLVGGLYLMLMDTLARTLFMPTELPVGVLTAFFGGPFFLLLLRRHRRKGGAK